MSPAPCSKPEPKAARINSSQHEPKGLCGFQRGKALRGLRDSKKGKKPPPHPNFSKLPKATDLLPPCRSLLAAASRAAIINHQRSERKYPVTMATEPCTWDHSSPNRQPGKDFPMLAPPSVRRLPGHTWTHRAPPSHEPRGQLEAKAGGTNPGAPAFPHRAAPKAELLPSSCLAAFHAPLHPLGCREFIPKGIEKQEQQPPRRKGGRAGGLLPRQPLKIHFHLRHPPLLPSPVPCSSRGSAGLRRTRRSRRSLGWGGVSARGALLWLFLGPAVLPSQPSSLGWRGKAQGMTAAAGTWDVCPSRGAQPTPSPACSESPVPHGN